MPDEPLPAVPPSLNRERAASFLADPDTDAFTALLSVMAFLQDDILDEDGQPYLEAELHEMLDAQHIEAYPDNLTRACGLLFALSGDEFLESPLLFTRFVAAVNEGDPFAYEDDGDDPPLADIFWAMYLVELLVEDDLTAELSPRVGRLIQRIAEQDVDDRPGLEAAIAEDGDDLEAIEDYMTACLAFRRHLLSCRLRELGVQAEWMRETDDDLAALLAAD